MRFGNVNVFAIELAPVRPGWRWRAPPDRGPWARLQIWIQGTNVTEYNIAGSSELEPGPYVPLAPIADWLVRNAKFITNEERPAVYSTSEDVQRSWERWIELSPPDGIDPDSWDDARFAWVKRHFLRTGSDGSWLPDLAFVRIEDRLWISIGRKPVAGDLQPLFHAPQARLHAVPWRSAEEVFGKFVDTVARSLREANLGSFFDWVGAESAFSRSASLTWLDVLGQPEIWGMSAFSEAFGTQDEWALRHRLGLPDTASPLDSVAWRAARDLIPSAGLAEPLLRCESVTRERRDGEFGSFREAITRDAAVSAEREGQQAANVVRGLLRIDGDPLPTDFEALLDDRAGIRVSDAGGADDRDYAIAGSHIDGSGLIVILATTRTSTEWARRMEVCRGLGHLLLDEA
ncbi:MAG: hypothetical protein ABI369_11725, partial [Acetobacteraceae bacterium]